MALVHFVARETYY